MCAAAWLETLSSPAAKLSLLSVSSAFDQPSWKECGALKQRVEQQCPIAPLSSLYAMYWLPPDPRGWKLPAWLRYRL
jgi:hypothetical protein